MLNRRSFLSLVLSVPVLPYFKLPPKRQSTLNREALLRIFQDHGTYKIQRQCEGLLTVHKPRGLFYPPDQDVAVAQYIATTDVELRGGNGLSMFHATVSVTGAELINCHTSEIINLFEWKFKSAGLALYELVNEMRA